MAPRLGTSTPKNALKQVTIRQKSAISGIIKRNYLRLKKLK
jgi:hypothetical protein